MKPMRKGETNPIVNKVRQYLGLKADNPEFDTRLHFFVVRFQADNELKVTGVVDEKSFTLMRHLYERKEHIRKSNSMVSQGVAPEVIDMECAFLAARYGAQALTSTMNDLQQSIRRFTAITSTAKKDGKPYAMQSGVAGSLLKEAAKAEDLIMQAQDYIRKEMMEPNGIEQPHDDALLQEYEDRRNA